MTTNGAAKIATSLLAYYAELPPRFRAEVFLDWHEARHWRATPCHCAHCHSPARTNLVDDRGRYSHKMCAEIADYLIGPPPEKPTR
jgi:hypothetical protein